MQFAPSANAVSGRRFAMQIGCFVLFCAVSSFATDFYVSPTGNDKSNGTSSNPWKSITRVNGGKYAAGDRIFFQGGSTFSGSLAFTSASAGTSANPILISSYGGSRATISAGSGSAISVYNAAGYYISNMNLVGGAGNTMIGISFYADLAGNVKLDTIHIDQVDISGFSTGIVIGAWNNLTGYKNVSITNANVHDNFKDGINVYGYTSRTLVGYAHQNFYIGHVTAHDNTGVAGSPRATGSGIVVGQTDGVLIERSLAYNNGASNTYNPGGPVGIWAYDSNNVVIQYNESHHNRTGSAVDGGGFDLDGGITNSTLQYNYSHDNDGPGYLICQYNGARPLYGNTVRYNISQNDGRKNGAGGIQFYNGGSGIKNVDVYNNTVYAGFSRAIYLQNATTNVAIRNNIIMATGSRMLLQVGGGQVGLVVQGNDYWPIGGGFYIYWAGTQYRDLPSFRAATGQEMYNGSQVGASVNPQLKAAGTGGTINNSDLLSTLTAYSPTATSPMIDTALPLSTMFGVNPGSTDFMGSAIYRGLAFDVGAIEY